MGRMASASGSSMLRRMEAGMAGLSRSLSRSVVRWLPEFILFRAGSVFRWPGPEFSVVDDVLWAFVVGFETLALVASLCFFFVFCGCQF